MPEQDLLQATAREDLCRFLAACYYEPDALLEEEQVFASMLAAANALSAELAANVHRVGEAFAAQDLHELVVDYTCLFMGPPAPSAPPYGSVWLSGEARVMDETTLALVELYRAAGFQVNEELHEPADHVALEFEFLYLLTFKCNEAQREPAEPAAVDFEDLRAAFLHDHLGAWGGRFAEAVKANAGTPFYRELAELTARFLHLEQQQLAVRAPARAAASS